VRLSYGQFHVVDAHGVKHSHAHQSLNWKPKQVIQYSLYETVKKEIQPIGNLNNQLAPLEKTYG
jgi:hypothetical protein